jgi:hypothetical protein
MLTDTLLLFKLLIGKDKGASLPMLLGMYMAWILHTPYDTISDTQALRAIVSQAFPDTVPACLIMAISYKEFVAHVSLNLYMLSPISLFFYQSEAEDADEDSVNCDIVSSISAGTV